jgi:enamine deaminase RidA (YjgF/YER057c/UK114 family)
MARIVGPAVSDGHPDGTVKGPEGYGSHGARERLRRLGFQLTPPLPPKGRYAASRRAGSLLYVSGHTGRTAKSPALRGVVGEDVDVEAAQESARMAAVNILGVVEDAVGLERASLVHLRGYVRADAEFTDHPQVVDAASELLAEVLDDDTRHARAAIGVSSLPGGAVVELEAVFEVAR